MPVMPVSILYQYLAKIKEPMPTFAFQNNSGSFKVTMTIKLKGNSYSITQEAQTQDAARQQLAERILTQLIPGESLDDILKMIHSSNPLPEPETPKPEEQSQSKEENRPPQTNSEPTEPVKASKQETEAATTPSPNTEPTPTESKPSVSQNKPEESAALPPTQEVPESKPETPETATPTPVNPTTESKPETAVVVAPPPPPEDDPVKLLGILCSQRKIKPPVAKESVMPGTWEMNLILNGTPYYACVHVWNKEEAQIQASRVLLLQIYPRCRTIEEVKEKIEGPQPGNQNAAKKRKVDPFANIPCTPQNNPYYRKIQTPPCVQTYQRNCGLPRAIITLPAQSSVGPQPPAMNDPISVFNIFCSCIKMNIPPFQMTSAANDVPVTTQVDLRLPDGTSLFAQGQGHDKDEARNDAALRILYMLHPELADFDTIKTHIKVFWFESTRHKSVYSTKARPNTFGIVGVR